VSQHTEQLLLEEQPDGNGGGGGNNDASMQQQCTGEYHYLNKYTELVPGLL